MSGGQSTVRPPAPHLGLIETARVEAGRVPLWDLHLERLAASAATLGLLLPPCLPSATEIAAAAAGVPGKVVAVRLTLRDGQVTLQARPVLAAAAGWTACSAPGMRDLGPPFLLHKTTERGEHDAAAREARERGCDEALWVDTGGRLAEGTITNIFARLGGRIVTPRLESGLLPGIARGRLLAIGHLSALPIEEGDIGPENLAQADEVFLTNAVRGAVPLIAWEGRALPRGELWRLAQKAIFSRMSGREPCKGR